MAPRDLVTAQYMLTFDADAKVQQAATQSLQNLDPRIANAVLGDTQLEPAVLGYLAEVQATNDAYAEKLLLNPKTPSSAFARVAEVCSEQIGEIIANNQARFLEVPEIARSLTKNPNALRSTVDRVVDFLVRNGIVLDGVRHFEDALLRLTGDERRKAADRIDLPKELISDEFLSDEDREELRERRLIAEDEELEESEETPKNIEDLLRHMNAA